VHGSRESARAKRAQALPERARTILPAAPPGDHPNNAPSQAAAIVATIAVISTARGTLSFHSRHNALPVEVESDHVAANRD
jgi:hypothetical protein